MSISERQLSSKVMKMLKPLDGVRVENPACPGTPDVNYIGGWVELKVAKCWPPRGGPLRIPHFTNQQRVWLIKRCHLGGTALLLLQVKAEWLLFNGAVAAKILGRVSKQELLSSAIQHWNSKPTGKDFRKCLLRN